MSRHAIEAARAGDRTELLQLLLTAFRAGSPQHPSFETLYPDLIDRVRNEVRYYRALLAHPSTPRASRWLLAFAIACLVSPIDLIPDAIPFLGQLDDLLIVPGLVGLAVAFIPAAVKAECRLRGQVATPPVERSAARRAG